MKSSPSNVSVAGGNPARSGGDDRLHFRDRFRGFDRPDVVPGPVARAQEMQVIVDESGDRGTAAEIDDTVALVGTHIVAHRHDAVAANPHRGLDGVAGIHRQEPAVDQYPVAADGAQIHCPTDSIGSICCSGSQPSNATVRTAAGHEVRILNRDREMFIFIASSCQTLTSRG